MSLPGGPDTFVATGSVGKTFVGTESQGTFVRGFPFAITEAEELGVFWVNNPPGIALYSTLYPDPNVFPWYVPQPGNYNLIFSAGPETGVDGIIVPTGGQATATLPEALRPGTYDFFVDAAIASLVTGITGSITILLGGAVLGRIDEHGWSSDTLVLGNSGLKGLIDSGLSEVHRGGKLDTVAVLGGHYYAALSIAVSGLICPSPVDLGLVYVSAINWVKPA